MSPRAAWQIFGAALALCTSAAVAEDAASWAAAERETLADLARRGYSVERDALAALPARNGARALAPAFAALDRLPDDARYAPSDVLELHGGDPTQTSCGHLSREEQLAQLQRVLKSAAPAFPAIEAALKAEGIAWAPAWAEGNPGKLQRGPRWADGVKELAWLLAARATVARAAGKHAEAWADLERLLAFARRVREPGLLGRGVRVALAGIGLQTLEHALGAGPPPPPPVRARLRAALEALTEREPLQVLVRTEVALTLASFEGREPLAGCEHVLGFSLAEHPIASRPEAERRAWVARERARYVARAAAAIGALEGDPAQAGERLQALPSIDPTSSPEGAGVLASVRDPASYARACLDKEHEQDEALRKHADALGR